MCGRARLSSDVSEIKLVFSIPPHRPTPNIAPSWNVAPTGPLPVDEQRQRHAERSAIVVTAWEIARQKGATIEERWEIYEREVGRLSREFEEKWGVPARV
jgi:putative SOS response-associated peptidase YedK